MKHMGGPSMAFLRGDPLCCPWRGCSSEQQQGILWGGAVQVAQFRR